MTSFASRCHYDSNAQVTRYKVFGVCTRVTDVSGDSYGQVPHNNNDREGGDKYEIETDDAGKLLRHGETGDANQKKN